MEKSRRARYTHEFRLEALRIVGVGQSTAAVAAILGLRALLLSAARAAPARDQDLTKCGSEKPDLTTFLLLGRKNLLTH